MNSTVALLSIAIALPLIALASWIWIVVQQVDREFRAELEGIHFDI